VSFKLAKCFEAQSVSSLVGFLVVGGVFYSANNDGAMCYWFFFISQLTARAMDSY
jgi:hypothetical protein